MALKVRIVVKIYAQSSVTHLFYFFFSTLFPPTSIGNQSHHSLNYLPVWFSPRNEKIQVYFLISSSFMHKRYHTIDRYSSVLCFFSLFWNTFYSNLQSLPPSLPLSYFPSYSCRVPCYEDVNLFLMLFLIFFVYKQCCND